jgi:parallel beta-helix repeat protein
MIYLIELERWGITQGFPAKPYTNNHFVVANNNIIGINNALMWASTNGYNHVVIPKGDYTICYPNPIKTQPNMIIDFNHSTFKVIYNSDVRSPYDPSSNPTYFFGGISILCTTKNSHIINLTLIGDRIDRSWNNSEEKKMEFTTGIAFGSGADFSSVRYCNISYYMGDGISSSYGPYTSFGIGKTEMGDINSSGLPIPSTTLKTVRSAEFIQLPLDTKSFTMIGLGYAPATTIPSGMYNAYFYKEDNTFITSKVFLRTRDRVNIPKGAKKMKLTWEGKGTADDGTLPNNPPYWALLLKEGLSEHLLIEYNEIHRCHRGGILIGTNNVTIKNNYLHDTGEPGITDIDGLPTFSDFTRYSICIEDHIGHNCKIKSNVFENSRLAIAIRGDMTEIFSNEFRNCTQGIMFYNQKNCIVRNNYFHYSGFSCFNYQNLYRNWMIHNNTFIGSAVRFEGSGQVTEVCHNLFIQGSTFETSVRIANFKDNVFKENSAFLNYSGKFSQTQIDGCSFYNSYLTFISIQDKVLDVIKDCYFEDSFIKHQSNYQIIIRDSLFKNSRYEYGSTQPTAVYTLINCKVENATSPLISNPKGAGMGLTRAVLDIKDSQVRMGTKSLIEGFGWGSLLISNSQIEFSSPPSLTTAIFSGFRNLTDSVEIKNSSIVANNANTTHSLDSVSRILLVNNDFINFEFTNPKQPIKTVDPDFLYIGFPLLGTSTPAKAPEYIGQLFIDTTTKKIYMSIGTTSQSDWVLIN